MESDLAPAQEVSEPKAEFRKLTNEATNRKYRRHSSSSPSSEEGSPKRDHITRGSSRTSSYEKRNYDKVDRSSTRSQHARDSRDGDSYRHSSRSNRHDDRSRFGKHADENSRSFTKPSDRSGRESRDGAKSDYRGRDSDYNRPRDRYRDLDRYPRDSSDRNRYDGRHGGRYDDRDRQARDRDHHQDERKEYRSSRDHKGYRAAHEDFKGHQDDSKSNKETGDVKDSTCSNYNKENSETERPEDIAAKRPKFSSSSDSRKDENLLSPSKHPNDNATKVSSEQGPVSAAGSVLSVNDATIRAIKAAQSVNQDLTGSMTAINSKKKLLWADKKSKSTEESSNRWDGAQFTDRERQEKFYKLMGVKGEVKVDPKPPSGQDAEKQRELQLELEKQYTAGLRRRDGRTVGLGL